jgi:hypothetical protein
MDLSTFLHTVITTPSGWLCVGVASQAGNGWVEVWFNWPDDEQAVIETVNKYRDEYNIYFSAYLFSQQSSVKANVLPSRTIQADLDEADINTLPVVPTILIQSSPGRHQAYWVLKDQLDNDAHEILSRKLTYAIPNCDRSGWTLGHKVRLPETNNFKYNDGPKKVFVVEASYKVYDSAELELLPDVVSPTYDIDNEWLDAEKVTPNIGPQELLETIKDKIPPKIYTQYNVTSKDRSAALWSLMCSAFRAGLSKDEVFYLAKNSANNKFDGLRHNADRELAKDVLRAEAVVKAKVTDVRKALSDIRKAGGAVHERRQLMLGIVITAMNQEGDFIRTTDDNIWYIRRDLGRPILIAARSEYLRMIMDLQFGLNATEIETSYVISGLAAYALSLPVASVNSSLSYYERESNTFIVHTGKRDVIRVTCTGVDKGVDGSFGVVFPWISSNEPFNPNFNTSIDWGEVLFGGALDNLLDFPKEEAMAILKVWLLFLMLRNSAVSRPIMAFFGQPGSGKSTLFRRIYALLYGRQRSLGAVTNSDDFDHSVTVDPLVVLDNVDTWERWLPDRLALAAATSDITRRKLYTDVDTVTMKRQALVGITAHNPRFGREDVADRLLLLTFRRLEQFVPEGDILDAILVKRNDLWGAIINDTQRVLRVPMPPAEECPQFRVEDFARIGYRISLALNCAKEFRSALRRIYSGQRLFSLEEEHLLVSAIQNMLVKQSRNNTNHSWRTVGNLWTELELNSADPVAFGRAYRNAVYLGKKLWAMNESLKEIFDIEYQFDKLRGTRVWKFGLKS